MNRLLEKYFICFIVLNLQAEVEKLREQTEGKMTDSIISTDETGAGTPEVGIILWIVNVLIVVYCCIEHCMLAHV